jgi:hypothetical protein
MRWYSRRHERAGWVLFLILILILILILLEKQRRATLGRFEIGD